MQIYLYRFHKIINFSCFCPFSILVLSKISAKSTQEYQILTYKEEFGQNMNVVVVFNRCKKHLRTPESLIFLWNSYLRIKNSYFWVDLADIWDWNKIENGQKHEKLMILWNLYRYICIKMRLKPLSSRKNHQNQSLMLNKVSTRARDENGGER